MVLVTRSAENHRFDAISEVDHWLQIADLVYRNARSCLRGWIPDVAEALSLLEHDSSDFVALGPRIHLEVPWPVQRNGVLG